MLPLGHGQMALQLWILALALVPAPSCSQLSRTRYGGSPLGRQEYSREATTGLTVNGGAKTVLIPLFITTEQMRMMYDDV